MRSPSRDVLCWGGTDEKHPNQITSRSNESAIPARGRGKDLTAQNTARCGKGFDLAAVLAEIAQVSFLTPHDHLRASQKHMNLHDVGQRLGVGQTLEQGLLP